MENSGKAYLTPADIVALYGLPIKTQNNLRYARKITYIKIGGRVMYKQEWIENYIKRNTYVADNEINQNVIAHA